MIVYLPFQFSKNKKKLNSRLLSLWQHGVDRMVIYTCILPIKISKTMFLLRSTTLPNNILIYLDFLNNLIL
jgi:uncharacterized membrane protein